MVFFFPRVHLLVSCKVESVAELGTSVPIALNQRCSPVSVLPLKLWCFPSAPSAPLWVFDGASASRLLWPQAADQRSVAPLEN